MNVRPLYDRVVVERAEAEEKTSGGIVLTSESMEPSKRGIVVSVGEGRVLGDGSLRALEVHVGDTVLFADEIEQTHLVDGKEYVIMKELNIMGVIVDE